MKIKSMVVIALTSTVSFCVGLSTLSTELEAAGRQGGGRGGQGRSQSRGDNGVTACITELHNALDNVEDTLLNPEDDSYASSRGGNRSRGSRQRDDRRGGDGQQGYDGPPQREYRGGGRY